MVQKIVLTGAPSSGKTSVATQLEIQGYNVIHETAEDYIRLLQAKGIKQPWTTRNFQRNIFKLQKQRENNHKKKYLWEGKHIPFSPSPNCHAYSSAPCGNSFRLFIWRFKDLLPMFITTVSLSCSFGLS